MSLDAFPPLLIHLLNHLWQSTIFAVLAAVLTLLLKGARARTRYWIWLASALKFFVPFSLVVLVGSRIPWRTAHAAAEHAWPSALVQALQPVPASAISISASFYASPEKHDLLPLFLSVVWACGFLIVLGLWSRRWRHIRAIVRRASPCELPLPLPALSSPALLEPAVFGIVKPVLLLPERLLTRLTAKELQAIYAHELCHVRHRDNLAAAAHMLLEAIFWFHPLVWWLERKLIAERERACDEEVLRSGNCPQDYAEGILAVCRFCLASPMPCAAGVSGADLRKRIETIMSERLGQELNTPKKLLLAMAGVMAIAVPVAIGLLNVPSSRAAQRETFEVVSIKLTNPAEQYMSVGGTRGNFSARGISPKMLIVNAYDVHQFQVTGGPNWLDSVHYDIEAKADDAESKDYLTTNHDQLRLAQAKRLARLQALLADRFKLKVHRLTKELPAYALVIAKHGPKLQPSKDKNDQSRYGMRMGPGMLNGNQLSMEALTANLSNVLGSIVIDKTGLTGNYDLALTWKPDEHRANPLTSDDTSKQTEGTSEEKGPSLFTAVQEQLGLKLVPQKGPVEVLVIDHIEKPSPN